MKTRLMRRRRHLLAARPLFVMCLTLRLLTKWLLRFWRFQGVLIVLSIMLALLIFARLKIPALRVGALLWQPILTVFIFVRMRFLPRLNKAVAALLILLRFPDCAHQHCALPMARQRLL